MSFLSKIQIGCIGAKHFSKSNWKNINLMNFSNQLKISMTISYTMGLCYDLSAYRDKYVLLIGEVAFINKLKSS